MIFNDQASKLSAQLKKANILVVDDFQGMRTMLRNIMKDAGGVNIETASNAGEAIAKLRLVPYDIVICDYNLGSGANGQQLLEDARLQGLIGTATIWIMVTAEKTHDMVMGAAEIKPDDYILKPINLELLESRLSKQLLRKQELGGIESAIRDQNYTVAVERCDQLLKNKPANPNDILRIKSDVLLSVGRLEDAASLFNQVLSIRKVPWAMTGLGKVHFQNKDYAAAAAAFREVLSSNRLFMEASDWLVKTLNAMGDTEGAQRALEEAVAISPKSGARQTELGKAAYANGDLDTAQSSFQKSITLNAFSPSKSASTFTGLAKVLSERKSPQEALNVLKQCKREFKDNPQAALQTAVVESMVLQTSGNEQQARTALQEALKHKEALGGDVSADTTLDLAQAMLGLGETEAATALLSTVVKNNHESELIRAKVQAVFDKANLSEQGQAMIKASAEDVLRINNEGVMLGRAGKFDEAIALLRQAADDMPSSEMVLLNLCGLLLASVKHKGRDPALLTEARALLDRVQKINPANRKLHEYAAFLASV